MLLLVIRIDLPKGENLRNKNLKVDGGKDWNENSFKIFYLKLHK
jgi:hypothetical protein